MLTTLEKPETQRNSDVPDIIRRSPRVANDPDKYIRVAKTGKYQARPYCSIERERYDLGLFETRHQARTAILEFWRGKRPDIPKYTRRIHTRDGHRYMVIIPYRGQTFVEGPFLTREEAAFAVRFICLGLVGREASVGMLKRQG
jgi:hypothetical protein